METTSKKRDRYDALMLLGIFVALLAVVVCTLATGYRYGSVIDWQSPDFLPEVGAGQNAYNFSYYGMLNPLIFPSYLMPFVSMVTYVEALSVLILLSMAWLFYGWLRHMQAHADVLGTVVSDWAIRLATCLFAFASPFLYHSHKQFVFVSYIPFLLLALIGVDRWFLKRRGLLLASMVTALFLTSYLHAVAAVVALLLARALPVGAGMLAGFIRLVVCGGVGLVIAFGLCMLFHIPEMHYVTDILNKLRRR